MEEVKPLMGVCLFGDSKNYVVPAWLRMYEVCCKGLVEPLVIGDRPVGDLPRIPVASPGIYSEDMLILGRDLLRLEAIKRGSPVLIWQGIDCLYESRKDFLALLETVQRRGAPVGALTCARSDASHAVARRFVDQEGGQKDIPAEELGWKGIVRAGFPGADALAIPSDYFIFGFHEHIPWYKRVEMGMANLCAEEFWCLNVVNAGHEVLLHCGIRTWHVHEDGVARKWPGEEVSLEELTWT